MHISHKPRPKSSTQAFTRGGQIFFHNWRMYFQILQRIVHWSLWIALIATLIISYFVFDIDQLRAIRYYYEAKLSSSLSSGNSPLIVMHQDREFTYLAKDLLASPKFNATVDNVFNTLLWIFMGSFSATLLVNYWLSRYFTHKGEEQTQDYLVRGTEIVPPQELEKRMKKCKNVSPFKLDGLQILAKDFEVRHLAFSGSTGTGKSVIIRKLLREIEARGDKAIIYDKGCTFVSRFYRPERDSILNPFDERSVDWTLWNDAKQFSDYENLATALIAQTGHGDPFWVEAARAILTNTAYQMTLDDQPLTTERLLTLLLKTPTAVLRDYLQGTMASAITDEKADKIAISVKAILAAYIKSLRYLEGLDKPDKSGHHRPVFSIRKWVQDDTQTGFLFFTSNAEQHVSLRPLISMWLSTASTAMLGLTENPNRRLWVIADELPSLHQLPDLASTLAEVRKYGGCYLLGFQSYPQFVKAYGQHAADEMYDLLNSRFYLRNPSSSVAKKTSDDLGEQELDISKEQYSYGANTVRDGISLGHQTITRPAVLPSEIMKLDDLACWYRPMGNFPITKIQFQYDDMPAIAAPFLCREYESSETMKEMDAYLAHCQFGALLALPDEDKRRLMQVYKAQHDGDENSMEKENQRMADNVKAQHDKTKRRNNDHYIEQQVRAEKKAIKQQQNGHEHLNTAFNNIENTTIDDIDMGVDP
ncbi:type IV conjugative transfer system coupling protein TraD [Photobacterium leiognathi]|uniref:type IV conjugative transfer system coupling protein TraD n=1 Tax=Photobacterium leiognathi TaxID=553611 RepID=UPI00273A259D|nr:type IV conjugative transfer system coupling protein TraD [Photobacterium leiognathi]